MSTSTGSKSLQSPLSFGTKGIDVLGVRVDAMSMQEVLAAIFESINERRQLKIGVVNAAKLVNMEHDPMLYADVTGSDIVLADGMSVVWAASVLGGELPERVAGVDIFLNVLRDGQSRKCRVYLLGASEEVSERVAQRIGREFEGIEIAGRRNGYFDEHEASQVAEDIRNSRSDILFVAISSPTKERFMSRWYDYMNVPVAHGVGGSFDVFAGKVERAPEILQRSGLEWLYRLLQEPNRLFWRYLRTNVLFIVYVLKQKFTRGGSA